MGELAPDDWRWLGAWKRAGGGRCSTSSPWLGGQPHPALRPGDGLAAGARAPPRRGPAAGWGGHALGHRLAGAELGAGRGAHDCGRDAGWRCRAASRQTCCAQGATRAGFRVKGRSALSVHPLRPGPQHLPWGALYLTLTRDAHSIGRCVVHCNSSRRVGWRGNKVFPSWSGRGLEEEDAPSSTLPGGRDCDPSAARLPGVRCSGWVPGPAPTG